MRYPRPPILHKDKTQLRKVKFLYFAGPAGFGRQQRTHYCWRLEVDIYTCLALLLLLLQHSPKAAAWGAESTTGVLLTQRTCARAVVVVVVVAGAADVKRSESPGREYIMLS